MELGPLALVQEKDMSYLLSRLPLPHVKQKGKIPLMMEFPVNEETAPYLVTSMTGMVWIESPMDPSPEMWAQDAPDTVVRVAVRPDAYQAGRFFKEVFEHVEQAGESRNWGNAHDYTEGGVLAAIEHVSHYDLGDLCLLYPPEHLYRPLDEPPLQLKEIAFEHECLPQPCSWMPLYSAAVVPKDREYLGSIGGFGRNGVVVIVHNAARGIAIASRRPRGG